MLLQTKSSSVVFGVLYFDNVTLRKNFFSHFYLVKYIQFDFFSLTSYVFQNICIFIFIKLEDITKKHYCKNCIVIY